MNVFPTSLFVAGVKKTLHRRRAWVGRTNNVLRTQRRKRTSGKLSYGPNVGRRTMDDPCRVGIGRFMAPRNTRARCLFAIVKMFGIKINVLFTKYSFFSLQRCHSMQCWGYRILPTGMRCFETRRLLVYMWLQRCFLTYLCILYLKWLPYFQRATVISNAMLRAPNPADRYVTPLNTETPCLYVIAKMF